MNTNTPIPFEVVKSKIEALNIPDLSNATIREIVKVVDQIEEATGEKFIRM